jgi:hypothetical protein
MTSREWQLWMDATDSLLRGSGVRIVCPHCGSSEVAYRFVGGGPARLGYGAVWCNTCLNGVWLSRLAIPEAVPMVSIEADPTSIDIPQFRQVTPLDE